VEEKTWSASVSFAKTPLDEIGAKVAELKAAGWVDSGRRGDPWVAVFDKRQPRDDADPEAELRRIMGDYWVSADEIRTLLASAS